MKYFLIFGPPGSGKGTHSEAIVEKYGLCHISTGELLRAEIAADTELGRQAQELISKGNLVPDSVVEKMIEAKFEQTKDVTGFLLDGFPRTLAQAKDLDAILEKKGETLSGVISLMVSDDTARKRIAHRAIIEGRADDSSEEIVNNRIATYHKQTEPLIAYYKEQGKYFEVNGDSLTLEANRARVLELMDRIK